MKPVPSDWPRISSAIYYKDPRAAIDWLCHAFGFEVRIKIEGEDGAIHHSELTFGEGVIMVGGEGAWNDNPERAFAKSPRSLDNANTQSLMVYVDDVDSHCARARAAGAVILTEPKDVDYGAEHWSDRGYSCEDLDGHTWYFAQRLRSPG